MSWKKTISEQFNDIQKRQGNTAAQGFDNSLFKFVEDLPKEIAQKKENAKSPPKKKANPDLGGGGVDEDSAGVDDMFSMDYTYCITFKVPEYISRSDLIKSAAYKALHDFCSKPEVNICISRTFGYWLGELDPFLEGRILKLFLNSPYKDSEDIRAMRKMTSNKNTPQPS